MALVEARLPSEHDVTAEGGTWAIISLGLLSRMTTTLRHIMHLEPLGRGVDAGVLLRSLYEHVVHFAWLAADPSDERIEEWIKDDLRLRLIADNDARAHGEWLYSDREGMQRQVEAMKGNRLVLADLAAAADKAWQGKLDAVGHKPKTKLSFRGLYAFVYRNYSAGAHPSYRGLNPVVEDLTPTLKRVVLEGPPEGRGPYGLATVIYSLALYVAAGSIGWPAEDDVEATFKAYPA
jgi:hypothetical protein